MHSTFEIVLLALVLTVVFPVAVISLATGSKPPESSSIRKSYMAIGIVNLRFPFSVEEDRIIKCYHLEPALRFVSDLGLLAICVVIATQLAIHFGLVASDLGETIKIWFGIPSFVLFAIYFSMLARAQQRLRETDRV